MDKIIDKKLISIGIFIFILIIIFKSVHIVPSGNRGVVIKFGAVQKDSLNEGMHFLNPLYNVEAISVREQVKNMVLTTYTKDLQVAEINVALTYSLNRDVSRLYQLIGLEYDEKLILPIVTTAIKDVIGKWEASNLIESREKAIAEMYFAIKKGLNSDYINFGTFSLLNIDYSDAFEKSIEEKQIATQDAIKAKNKTVQIREEANQKVITAKAEAEAMRIKASALASNKALVEYEAVQKWDGKLPTYTGGQIPFLNLTK